MNWPPIGIGKKTALKASELVDQEVMRFLILAANGNVDIQSRNIVSVTDPLGAAIEGRLICRNCGERKTFDVSVFMDKSALLKELEWANNHAHSPVMQNDAPVNLDTGRRLKVVL